MGEVTVPKVDDDDDLHDARLVPSCVIHSSFLLDCVLSFSFASTVSRTTSTVIASARRL